MRILTRLAVAIVIVTACTNATFAATAPAGIDTTARTRAMRVTASQAELSQESVFEDSDDALLAQAQVTLDRSVAASEIAHDKAIRLQASASDLRRDAYALTDQPGLSPEQNRKMLAAMEAADAAESEARVAQTCDRLAAASVTVYRQAIARLTGQIAALEQRMDACTAFIRSNGYSVPARRRATALDTVLVPSGL